MVRTVTTREVEFDDEQYELLSASQAYEDGIHPECGHPLEESTSPLADAFNPQGEWKYEVGLPVRCHACTALNDRRKQYDGDNYDNARLFFAERVERT